MINYDDVKSIEIFEGLTEEELNLIKDFCQEEQHKQGDLIFTENSAATHLYILKAGRIAVEVKVSDEKQVNVYTISHGGESFGWSALVEPYKFTANARCVEGSKVISIDGQKLKDAIQQDYRLGYIIMGKVSKIISTRLQNTRLQLISLAYG